MPAPNQRRAPKAVTTDDVMERLKTIVSDSDPNKLYRNLTKIGQGWVFWNVARAHFG